MNMYEHLWSIMDSYLCSYMMSTHDALSRTMIAYDELWWIMLSVDE